LNEKLADLYNARFLSYLRAVAAQAVEHDRPVKGVIYTESEIQEFKRRGLM